MTQSEVLVHISAPSTVSNDAHYRAQVEAILGFEPFSHQLITLRSDDGDQIPDPNPAAGRRLSASPGQEQHNARPCIYKPSNNTTASPVPRQTRYDKDSLGTPLSVIPDSQPERPPPDPQDLQEIEPPRSSPVSCLDEHPDNGTPPNDDKFLSLPPPSAHDDDNSENDNYDNVPLTRDHASLPMEIRPRSPPISSERFVTHITPTLAMLATRLKSPRTYNPIKQTRALDNLERGYWYVRVNLETPGPNEQHKPANPTPMAWDMTFFTRFWTFLSEFIAKERRAGWGVWCILEDVETIAQSSREPGHIKPVTLKVYAWGEIASHVYLLLFLASERRVRKMGLQWRDSAEEVVIQMP
ncbi:uncharacterized protein BO80DRAFT_490815 [Aspergillus ibericus CBS 121593]|uniref:Acetamidase n=1 Tax=Aspergillus ibericus CBS 121593 TaxID=1448316 RepID=A0A395HED0_9EURO|nr:hypothetical protein BO80DRAFT_490815 [Aspergillus ibericus CBS 121593]RAL04584.1 hypothetical protein BO80DRAFT_490815 [Aspergillus ibericus CBS 121593]